MTLAGLVLGLGTSVGEAALTKPEPPSASDDVITVAEDTNSRVSRPGVLKNDQLRSMGPLRALLVSTTGVTARGARSMATTSARLSGCPFARCPP